MRLTHSSFSIDLFPLLTNLHRAFGCLVTIGVAFLSQAFGRGLSRKKCTAGKGQGSNGISKVHSLSPYGLTQCLKGLPARPARRFSAAMVAIAFRVWTVALAMCGATITLGSRSSGLPGSG